eukprot:6180043-Pleurochrysis_carterae.AAC.1
MELQGCRALYMRTCGAAGERTFRAACTGLYALAREHVWHGGESMCACFMSFTLHVKITTQTAFTKHTIS